MMVLFSSYRFKSASFRHILLTLQIRHVCLVSVMTQRDCGARALLL